MFRVVCVVVEVVLLWHVLCGLCCAWDVRVVVVVLCCAVLVMVVVVVCVCVFRSTTTVCASKTPPYVPSYACVSCDKLAFYAW